MPRKINPGSISVGTGRAPAKSVDPTAFINPNQGLETVTAHINDPDQAHMASTIGIVDTGAYFTSDEVEGALQELGADSTASYDSRQNGWFSGGTTTEVGLVVTMAANSIAIVDTGRVDVSGDTITLPNNTTRWLYVDHATGVVSASAGVPDITTNENVIIGFYTTSGGAVTAKVDGRFFIRNDNRKIPITVRSEGSAANANSEGAFMTLEAALLWVDTFVGSGVSAKTEITVRGSITVSDTITLNTPNVVFRGEDGAEIITGAFVYPLFNLNSSSGIEFHGITFTCNHGGSLAISDASPFINNLLVEGCSFNPSGGNWDTAISLASNSASFCRVVDCNITTDNIGFTATNLSFSHIERTNFYGLGVANPAMVLGSAVGAVTCSDNTITNCYVDSGWTRSIDCRVSNTVISDNLLSPVADTNVFVDAGSQNVMLSGNTFTDGNSDYAIYVEGQNTTNKYTRNINVVSNKVGKANIAGVYFTGYVRDSHIRGNTIDGYNGANSPVMHGVLIQNATTSTPSDIIIEANNIRRCRNGVVLSGELNTRPYGTFTVVNNANVTAGDTITIGSTVLTAVAGAPGANQFQIGGGANATATNIAASINTNVNKVLASASTNTVTVYSIYPGTFDNTKALASSDVTGITVSGSTMAGGAYKNVTNITVSNNDIHHCEYSQTGAGTAFLDYGCFGVAFYNANNIKVQGNNIHQMGIIVSNADVPSQPTNLGADVFPYGVFALNSTSYSITDNNIADTVPKGAGVAYGVSHVQMSTGVEPGFTYEVNGVQIESNNIHWDQLTGDNLAIGGAAGDYGIYVAVTLGTDDTTSDHLLQGTSIIDNKINDVIVDGITLLAGDYTTVRATVIEGNQVFNSDARGISVFAADVSVAGGTTSVNEIQVEDNQVIDVHTVGIQFSGTRTTGTRSFYDINILDNQVRASGSHGIEVACDVANFNLSAVSINDNRLRSNGTDTNTDSAIYVSMDSNTSGGSSKFDINGNDIVAPNDSTFAAIYLHMADDHLADVSISDNQIYDAFNTGIVGSGIRVAIDGAGSKYLDHLLIANNTIRSQKSCLSIESTGEVTNLSISDNIFEAGTAGTILDPARPVFVQAATNGSASANNHDIVVTGNAFHHGDGCRFESLSEIPFENVTITGNVFDITDQTANPVLSGKPVGFFAGLSIYAEGGAAVTPILQNITVTGNAFQNIQKEGLSIAYGAVVGNRYMANLTISDNVFDTCATTFVGGGTSCVVHLFASYAMSDIHVINNAFRSCTPSNAFDTVMVNIAAIVCMGSMGDVQSSQINGNTFTNCKCTSTTTHGIMTIAAAVAFFAVGNLKTSSITENIAENLTLYSESNTESAKSFFLGAFSVGDIWDVDMAHNILRDSNFESQIHANVDGNSAGLWAASIGTMCGVQFNDNTVSTSTFTVDRNGAVGRELPNSFYVTGAGIQDTSISRNVSRSNSFVGVQTSSYEATFMVESLTTAVYNVQLDGNQFFGDSGIGAYVELLSGSNVTFSNNQMLVTPAGSLNALYWIMDNASQDIQVQNNQFTGYSSLDFSFGNSVDRLDITNNQFNGTGDAILLSVIADNGDDFGQWNIAHNQLTTDAGRGIVVTALNSTNGQTFNLRHVTTAHNVISSTTEAITMTFTRSDVYNLSVNHNIATIGTADNHGIHIELDPGNGGADGDRKFRDLDVSHNSLEQFGGNAGSDYAGIHIYGPQRTGDVGIRNLTVQANNLSTTRSRSKGVWIESCLNDQLNVSIQGNNVYYPSGGNQTGFEFDATGGTCQNWTILGNNVRGASTTATSGGVTYNYIIVAMNTSNAVTNWGTWTGAIPVAANQTFTPNQA